MELLQVAQRATDLPRATDFYTRLLGTGPVGRFDPPGLVFFRLGGTRLLLEAGAPSSLIYLRVDSVRAAVRRLRAEGVAVVGEPRMIFRHDDDALGTAGTAEWQAFILDSEGNTVGLASLEAPEPE
ncbi:VOC family protein [Arthrobacter halodurans]|uniref:VOC family protein n=1 Tax=Arthrobacter halodurans TaxID=516699 RepID=A0ABV4UI89_9MICC